MSEYKEMNPFTGKEIDEDAPANASGPSVAGTGDDNTVHTMKKKKKKTLYDGRTRLAKKLATLNSVKSTPSLSSLTDRNATRIYMGNECNTRCMQHIISICSISISFVY